MVLIIIFIAEWNGLNDHCTHRRFNDSKRLIVSLIVIIHGLHHVLHHVLHHGLHDRWTSATSQSAKW
jgi:hypothetical protein